MKGVTLATFRRYFGKSKTKAELKAIADSQLQHIYKTGYWDTVNGDALDPGVDLATFDYSVNSGPGAAKKSLMAVVGGSSADTVKKLCARRLSIYRTFNTWKTFGKGWTNRVVAIEAKGVAWATAAAGGSVKSVLKEEVSVAKSAAGKQTTAAGGTGAGGAAVTATNSFDWWVIAAFIAAAVVIGGILLWKAQINRARAEAYAKEASDAQ